MALLAEYALTPDVFDPSFYSSADVCGVHLQYLRDALLNDALVRDLRNGNWSTLLTGGQRLMHGRTKELMKTLAKERRLRRVPQVSAGVPTTDKDWCDEALASHQAEILTGIISTEAIKNEYPQETLVARIDRVLHAPWWAGNKPSVRMHRAMCEYLACLNLLLKSANSVFFIDAHIDPRQRRYNEFLELLRATSGRVPAPLLQVHRVCYFDTQNRQDQMDEAGWKAMFTSWVVPLQSARVAAEVFIWDDFHDRYVISDLIGIQMGNGFDTTSDPASVTTWNRLGRDERDDIQREFDPASRRHALLHRFTIPL